MFRLFRLKSRTLLTLLALVCMSFIVVALVLQHIKGVQTCPLCVLQRYAFIAVGLFCLVGAWFNAPRLGAFCAFAAALAGTATAGWQVWISTKPGLGCGIDPLEQIVNSLITAKWMPFLFHAKGSCGEDNFRLFWLSIPQWSLLWFALFAIVLLWILLRRGK